MFAKNFLDRIRHWKEFRESLETSETPIDDTIDFWSHAPLTTIAADPYDQEKWPGPWEMIEENIFCPFVKLLAICYTLQLTDKFSTTRFEINIVQDKENSETKYLLNFNGLCIGYDSSRAISISKLPKSLTLEKSYTMPYLQ